MKKKLIKFLGDLSGSPLAQAEAIARGAEILNITPRLLKSEIKADRERRAQDAEQGIDFEKVGASCAYESERGRYWVETQPGVQWSPRSREDFQLRLEIDEGLARKAPKHGGPSPAERTLKHVQDNRAFDVAIPLGGLTAGVHVLNGNRVLVPQARFPMKGVPGDCGPVLNFAQIMLGRGRDALWFIQWIVFVCILKQARAALNFYRLHRPRQLLGLIGPGGSGKTMTQNQIITPLVGGREADPGKYLTGRTDFNEGDWGADHLVLSDATLDPRPGMARRLRDGVKEMVANPLSIYHPKGRSLRTLPQRWLVTLSANDDPTSVTVIPEIDSSTADKFSYLKCYRPETPFPAQNTAEAAEFWGAIKDALPAFAHYVDTFEIPAEHADPRWGVQAWRHPEIMRLIDQTNPYARLGEFLDRWLESHPEAQIADTAERLWGAFYAGNEKVFPGLCRDTTYLGQALARLAKVGGWVGRIASDTFREGPNRAEKTVWTLSKTAIEATEVDENGQAEGSEG